MAGTLVKRHREEGIDIFNDNIQAKRHKSYNTATKIKQHALVSFLEQEEEEEELVVSSQDLSLFFSTLQQELFSDPSEPDPHGLMGPSTEDWNPCSNSVATKAENEDDGKESVIIRHLLEASDDELGLPNDAGVDRTACSGTDEDFNGLDDADKHRSSLLCDGLWELEDEAANYYTLLQSQLFM